MQEISFDERGLVPFIVQDWRTGEVLTLAYMNAEALERTRATGETHFWSRSRSELWHKGATSGNVQRVRELRFDCDADAVLALVEPAGPACHTGERTCFHNGELEPPAPHEALPALERTVAARGAERPEGAEATSGFKRTASWLSVARIHTAARAVGLARGALEESITYSKERHAFGGPISNLQAIQFMLADMQMNIDAARHLTWHSAWTIDQGQRNSLEAAMAKAFAADMCMKVTTDAVQVFGGYGYSREYPVEKLMRDAKVMQIYEGTSQIQRLIIARQMLKS
jgi:phosphoribosyl-AMP cyclohydrolase